MRSFSKQAYALVSSIEVGGCSVVTNYEYTIASMKEFFSSGTPVILYPLPVFDDEYLEIKKNFGESFLFICLSRRIAKQMGLGFLQGATIVFYPRNFVNLFDLISLEHLDIAQAILTFRNRFTSLKTLRAILKLPSYNPYSGFLSILFILNFANARLFQYNKFILNSNFKLINHGKYNSIRA